MRLLLVLVTVLIGIGPASAASARLLHLPDADSASGGLVARVLDDLKRGDLRGLAHLDYRAVLSPIGIDTDKGRLHWTWALRQHLTSADHRHRTFVDQTLDDLLGRTPDEARIPVSLRLRGLCGAADSLIWTTAARHFDHGHMQRFLALADRGDRRWHIAQAALGQAGDAGLAIDLIASGIGPLQAIDRVATAAPSMWHIGGGRALRLDDDGGVLWQRSLPGSATVTVGTTALHLATATACWLWHADGRQERLHSDPSGQLLGLDAAGCWHWQDDTAICSDGTIITLPATPLQAPCTIGPDQRVWLTGDLLLVEAGGTIRHRWRHGLEQADDFRLQRHLDQVVLVGPDRDMLAVTGLNAALTAATAGDRPRLLLQAERLTDARQAISALPESDQVKPLAALLQRQPNLATEADWHLIHRQPHPDALSAADAAAAQGNATASELRQWLAERFPEAIAKRHQGAHLIHGRAFTMPADTYAKATTFDLVRHPDLGWVRRLDSGAIRLRGSAAATEVVAFDWHSATPLWRHRWATPGTLPSRTARWLNGYLVVFEAQLRAHVLAPTTGDRLASFRPGRNLGFADAWQLVTPSVAAVRQTANHWILVPPTDIDATKHRLNLSEPATDLTLIDNTIQFRHPDGTTTTITLPWAASVPSTGVTP